MTRRSRRLSDQLDAALDGRLSGLPEELVHLVPLAEAIRHAALRIQPGLPSPAP